MASARRLTLSAMGAVMAVAAFEHGLGDALQGPVAPASIFIQSWPTSAFYRSLSGEPAMTLIPNLLISGIATMALSIALLGWVLAFVDRRYSAAVIAASSVALLLVGGGFGPPVLGLILAAAATKVRSPLRWWCAVCPSGVRRALASAWPVAIVACVITWLIMLFGIPALDYFAGLGSEALTYLMIAAAFVVLPFALISGMAHDAQAMGSTHS